jgi:hypothetical protein
MQMILLQRLILLGAVLMVMCNAAEERTAAHSSLLACLAPDVVATLELLETSATAASAAGWSATAAAMTSSSARAGAASWPKNATLAAMSPPASSSRLLAALLVLSAALHTKARVGRVVKQRCRLLLCTCLDLFKQFIELILGGRNKDPYTAEILIYATTSSSGRNSMRCQ